MAGYSAYAKINLFLHVLAREASGFHQIETLFCALELANEIEVVARTGGLVLNVEGEDLGPAEQNLVWRAAVTFYARLGRLPGAHIRLRKRIPVGAGLGGGSSDAATTLFALNELHRRPFARNALLDMGARLGSNVPFFVSRAALALAWGRGERLLCLPALDSAPVVLAIPPQRILTAEAYRGLAQRRAGARRNGIVARRFSAGELLEWREVAALAGNDFEAVACGEIPAVQAALDTLRSSGAECAQLTGSGSAVFGVFEDRETAAGAQAALQAALPALTVLLTRTLSRADAVDPVSSGR